MGEKKPNPLVHPPCPKCGKPLTIGGSIGYGFKRCDACGYYEEHPT